MPRCTSNPRTRKSYRHDLLDEHVHPVVKGFDRQRLLRGLRVKDVAPLLGTLAATYSRWRQGRQPGEKAIARMTKVMEEWESEDASGTNDRWHDAAD